MDTIEAIRSRRSVRAFEDRPVPRALIEALIRDAACGPHIFVNLPEPWLFTAISGRERIARYGETAKAYAQAHRPQVQHYEWTDRPDFSVFHGAPAVILISGPRDDRLAQSDCERAGQNLTLSAHARGLGSCWVGSPMLWLRDPATRAELRIPEGFWPHAAFALGYRAAMPPAPPLIPIRTIWIGEEAVAPN
jgi:nitroreductase